MAVSMLASRDRRMTERVFSPLAVKSASVVSTISSKAGADLVWA